MKSLRWTAALCMAAGLLACDAGSGGGDRDASGRQDASGVDGGGRDASIDAPGRDARSDGDPTFDGGACEAPDMLIVLDRTMSMHRRVDGTVPPDTAAGRAESKWFIAVDAIEQVAARLDSTVRFGLELFPRDPGGDVCVTVSQRIRDMTATNPDCEEGEVVVSPGPSTAGAIAAAIDGDTTQLCKSTPIGAGIDTARAELARVADPVREQFVLLITDGRDTCDDALLIANVQELARAGVRTWVIGFDGSGTGIDAGTLYNAACAGHTAPGFPAPCADDGAGNYTATDPGGPQLFLQASDADALVTALEDVAGEVCCGCVI